MICSNCGAQQPDSAAFCAECGATAGKAASRSYSAPPQSPPDFPPTRRAPRAGSSGHPAGASSGGGLTCSNCGASLEADSAFCDMCGTRVSQVPQPRPGGQYQPPPPKPQSPSPYERATPPPPPRDAYATVAAPPAPPPPPTVNARLVVHPGNQALPLPQGKPEAIIGRDDPVGGLYPDVDLTDCGGDDAGVSRQHARIYFQGGRAFIEDRGSTNRTYVNGQPLSPWQAHPLQSGDEVRFGRLKTVFYM